MRILYIDTSSNYLYAAIAAENKILSEVKKEFGHSLSEEALPEIVELFTKTNLTPKDIGKIIVVNGPGSFTGIRIGITIAKVYAWSLNIPITTISGLEAMMLSAPEGKIRVPMLDARRRYVFAAIYNEENEPILKPKHIQIDELNKELEKLSEYIIITNDEIDDYEETQPYNPDLLKIINYYKDKEAINPHAINPDYLKLTEAEESKL